MKKILIKIALLFGINSVVVAQSSLYPEMVFVKGGTFIMGDSWGDGDSDEHPEHQVTLGNFKISKTEVTVRQYMQYCSETGRKMPESPSWGWLDDHPISKVSWHDCVAYCDWLAEKLDADYRLPTEAEWEYAARGGKQSKGTKYSGGRIIDLVGWFDENSNGRTQQVATKKPNKLGLYDMSGNVWEWCRDGYEESYYKNSPSTNPRGPSTGSFRVVRGGGWGDSAKDCRVANRFDDPPFNRYRDLGFRVVLSQ